MAAQATLVLRDIHQPPAPPWWPPAPGWWLVAAFVIAAVAAWALLRWRRRRRVAAHAAVFDAALAAAATPSEQVATMSELLRRAARQRDPTADRLHGEAWLAFLDGEDGTCPFTVGAGRLLLDGGYRPDVEPARISALRPLARARFLEMLERGPASASARRGHGHAADVTARFRRFRRRGSAVAPVCASKTSKTDVAPTPADFRLRSSVASAPSPVSTQAPGCNPFDPARDAGHDVTRLQPSHESTRCTCSARSSGSSARLANRSPMRLCTVCIAR
jgi:hypothetical protein